MKYIYYALLVSGLSILLIKRRQLDSRLQLFIPLLFLAIVTELSFDYRKQFIVYHIYQWIECGILCTYYYLLLGQSRYRSLILLALLAYFCYFAAFFIRFPQKMFHYDPIDFAAEAFFVTVFSLYYLVNLYRSGEEVNIRQHPHFWIASGNLLFYSGALLFMCVAFPLMMKDKQWYVQLGTLVKFLNLVLYLIYIKAFLCRLQEKSLA